ncbi:MAG: glycosyltransferase [Prevotellaceae bacterium]|nr:glycosyltransferase [Prevotellaceae bacterium]
MIPKIIHYCWFGDNPLPKLALECIASWRKFLPDYEIWAWVDDEINFRANGLAVDGISVADKVLPFDVNIIPYTAEAYKQKKYAFVSDYARFWILYECGGIYFDTDVEVIRPLDDIIARGNYMGFEMDPDGQNTPGKYAPSYCFEVNPGLGFGLEKGCGFVSEILDLYRSLHFDMSVPYPWFKTVVAYTTELLCEHGLRNTDGIQHVAGITIYPREYFAPINIITQRQHITDNTRTVHRYMASWSNGNNRSLTMMIRRMLPESILVQINKIKRQKYKIR